MVAKKTKKPVTKKVTKKKVVKKKDTDLVVVTEKAIMEPEKDGNKYTLQTSFVKEKQILKILQRTPAEHIYSRPAKGGGTWSYVTGTYIKKVLNYVFGWLWDFEIIEHGEKGNQVWVLGRLTVKDGKGLTITKTQFGRADIKCKRGTKEPLDFGNDLKAASTDALKKCASEFGIASDIYGKNEFKDIKKTVKKDDQKEITFENAKGLIEKETDEGALFAFLEQVKKSKKYTAEQKKEINRLVSGRVDQLNT